MPEVHLFPMGPAQSWAFLIMVFALVGCLVWLCRDFLERVVPLPGRDADSSNDQSTTPARIERRAQLRLVPALPDESEPYDYEKHGL